MGEDETDRIGEQSEFTTTADLSDHSARLGEHGGVLMFRRLFEEGEEILEAVAATFRADAGEPGVSLWINKEHYFLRTADLEKALLDPPASRTAAAP